MFSTRNQQFIFCINDSYHSFGKTKLQHAQYKMWYRHTACKDAHTHTHTQTQLYIYIYLHPLTCFALLSGGALIAPAAPPGAGSRMIMNISVSRANTHTLSLRRSPSPSLPLSLPSPLLSSALALYVLSVIKLPLPPQKKVSLDRFLFLNSEKCVKNSVPFTQWLQLSLCPGKHKRS